MIVLGFIISGLVMLVGYAIVANAAFDDRAQFGGWVFLIGLVMLIGAVAEAVFR